MYVLLFVAKPNTVYTNKINRNSYIWCCIQRL